MRTIKIIIIGLFLLGLSFRPVLAGTLKLSLSRLPAYKNTSSFRLYYTYFETDNKTATVNLYIQKDGKDWRQTSDRDKLAVSGYFEVGGADFYDNEGKYNFYAKATTADQSITSETVSTTLDQSAPGTPSEYGKERVNSTTFRLTWKNPADEDFEKVYIYRSKDGSFTADASTRIGEAGGAKEEKMTFNDGSVEDGVDYYYALRAIDHAGNASGVVTDAPGTVTAGQVAGLATAAGEGEVQLLPQKEPSPEAGETPGELGGGISSETGEIKGTAVQNLTRQPILIAGIVLVIVAALSFFFYNRRKTA